METRDVGPRLLDAALWGAAFILLALSFALSWGAPPKFGPTFIGEDKVWHFLGYGALCGSLLLAAVWRPGRGEGRFPRMGLRIAMLVLGVAWFTEALQAAFGRDTDLRDALADLAGVAIAFGCWRATARTRSRPAAR